jgi:hypothetical protein
MYHLAVYLLCISKYFYNKHEKEMSETNPQEEIAYIKNIINDSKRLIVDDGKGFILWGILVITGLLITFFSLYYKEYEYLWYAWPTLMGFGWIYTLIVEIRKGKRKKVSTFARKIMGALWFSTGLSMTIIVLVGIYADAFSPGYISPIVSAVLGIAYFVTGVLYGKKWVSLLALGWWAVSIYTFLFTSLYNLLIFAAVMFLLQTLPGIILYQNSKKSL